MSKQNFAFNRIVPAACGTLAALLLAGMLAASPATAAAAPHWHLEAEATPSHLVPGEKGEIVLAATNLGDAEVDGTEESVTLTDKLPAGVVAAAKPTGLTALPGHVTALPPESETSGKVKIKVTCNETPIECTFAGPLPPYGRLQVTVLVTIEAAAASGDNELTVSGGKTPAASLTTPITVGSTPVPFGVERYEVAPEDEDGTTESQAGAHPFQLTTSLALNRDAEPELFGTVEIGIYPRPAGGLPKNLHFKLPPGLVGNPTSTPRCTDLDFQRRIFETANLCPADTAVGVAAFSVYEAKSAHYVTYAAPLFNLEPEEGEPARFGFVATEASIVLKTAVRTGGGYGVTVSASNLTEAAGLISSSVTFWGDPASPVHNQSRGWACLSDNTVGEGSCEPESGAQETPFLTLPTLCGGPIDTPLEIDSWKEPEFLPSIEPAYEPSIAGCESLSFDPGIEVTPETKKVDSPTGLDFGLKVPQNEEPEGLATPELKDATVTLPAGMTIDPAGGQGLAACTDEEFAVDSAEAAACPEASKIGTVEVATPLLEKPLEGALFVGEPLCGNTAHPNECTPANAENGSLFQLFLQAQGSGVTVKLPGDATINQANDQVTTSFPEDPQLPFSELKLDIKGGPRAPLATPQSCAGLPTGPGGLPLATSTSDLVSWSSPFIVAATPSSGFELSGCTNPMTFIPGFSAGTTSAQAGSFTQFTTTITRGDGQQDLSGISVTLPEGVAGIIANVPQCAEAQANAGTCGEASRLGTARVAAGAGSEPLSLQGPVYFTGPYKNNPFGLSVVVPAKAGPYNLGNEVVRAGISVNPDTAQVTVTSEPLRLARDGIPFRIKSINVSVERPGFMFNPTDCEALSATGSLTGQSPEGAVGSTVAVSSPFAVTGCKDLAFKPRFSAYTHAGHTRRDGAYLRVQVKTSAGEANIHRVRVALPKKLPSELETLKHACTEEQFAANPADCPKESMVGSAVAHTPVLSVPLRGPAIFVSHGKKGFPNLDVVLQGDGVAITLVGDTFINAKTGITTSTFATVPDVPVSNFELTLPEHPFSALGGNGSFCAKPLYMPTTIDGQNGKAIEHRTRIHVSGCKPLLRILSHKAKGASAKIRLSVPSAGKLVVSGKGIKTVARKLTKAKVTKVTVRLTHTYKAVLAKHKHTRARVKLTLRLKPKHGKTLTTHLTVLLR